MEKSRRKLDFDRQNSNTLSNVGHEKRRSARLNRSPISPCNRCVKVNTIDKAKNITRVSVTLSPNKHLKVNTDFELRIKNAEDFQVTTDDQDDQNKSYSFYIDPDEPVNAYLIFKENGKEVHEITLNDLQQKQEHNYEEVCVAVSPAKTKLPELRIYGTGSLLCEKEKTFLKKRKLVVKKGIEELCNNLLNEEEVPNIALMGSGGGYRAMIAMSGVINALNDTKLLDTIMYSAALSGSSWYLAVLYSHQSWPNIDPREVQQQLRENVTSKQRSLWKILLKTPKSWIISHWKGREWDFTSDIFGPQLGKSLIPDRMECKWSEQERTVKDGKVPLPLLAAIHVREGKDVDEFHEWVEISPYEVNFSKYGAAIEMKHFGRKFKKGFVEGEEEELPLYQIMGMCGSAYTIIFSELEKRKSCRIKSRKRKSAESMNKGEIWKSTPKKKLRQCRDQCPSGSDSTSSDENCDDLDDNCTNKDSDEPTEEEIKGFLNASSEIRMKHESNKKK